MSESVDTNPHFQENPSSFQIYHERCGVGGRDAGYARRLAETARPYGGEFLSRFDPQSL